MNIFKIAFPEEAGNPRHTIEAYSEILKEHCEEGFIFSPFGHNAPVYTIPSGNRKVNDECIDEWCRENDLKNPDLPLMTPTKDHHLNLVRKAIEFVRSTEGSTGKFSKVIAARVSLEFTELTPTLLFDRLKEHYPTATVFLFSTPISGTWIGATPELLISIDKGAGQLHTMALAGTRPAGTDAPWDQKNLREQQIVTDYIVDNLEAAGIAVSQNGPFTLQAGEIEHPCTQITGVLPKSLTDSLQDTTTAVATLLSPTPALCGYPRDKAEKFITEHEANPRGYYGGFVGFLSDDRANIYVNLRSGRWQKERGRIALYAGGGITSQSNPEAEWIETERKLTTLKSLLSNS